MKWMAKVNTLLMLIGFMVCGFGDEKPTGSPGQMTVGVRAVAAKVSGGRGTAAKLKAMGVNVVMDREGNAELRAECGELGIKYFRIYNVFCGLPRGKAFPPVVLVGEDGQPPGGLQAAWGFFPPTRQDIWKAKIEEIVADIQRLKPDGISLDVIRFFAQWIGTAAKEKQLGWEDVPSAQMGGGRAGMRSFDFAPETLAQFQADTGVRLKTPLTDPAACAKEILGNHRPEWKKWKCGLIESKVSEITKAARRVNPEILVMLQLVPWSPEEYDGALAEVIGQNPSELAKHADVLSPMAYHPLLGRKPDWVGELTAKLLKLTGKAVWPCIQAEGVLDLDRIPFKPEAVRAAWAAVEKSGADGISLYGPSLTDADVCCVIDELAHAK